MVMVVRVFVSGDVSGVVVSDVGVGGCVVYNDVVVNERVIMIVGGGTATALYKNIDIDKKVHKLNYKAGNYLLLLL